MNENGLAQNRIFASAILETPMKCLLSILTAVVLFAGSAGSGAAQTASAPSQTSAPGGVLGSVTNGNTTVVFESANLNDLDSPHLMAWDSFAAAHPTIAHALAFNPSLMNNAQYLKRHPELNQFFQAHPEVRAAMAADPGNFAAIPPRPGE
jgi:hypothetical protein